MQLSLTVLLLSAMFPLLPCYATVVDAEAHTSFWLWGGVEPQPALRRAEHLYVLQGYVHQERRARGIRTVVETQGPAVRHMGECKVWLVYRTETLEWSPEIATGIVRRLGIWRMAGNEVVGFQVDHDVSTRLLPAYVEFLRRLRAQVPRSYRLSITGLLDWSNHGEVQALAELATVVDEVVVQTYQGSATIPNYRSYLAGLKRLTCPYKIGLIQHGEWTEPAELLRNPWFRGYVVFLMNRK